MDDWSEEEDDDSSEDDPSIEEDATSAITLATAFLDMTKGVAAAIVLET